MSDDSRYDLALISAQLRQVQSDVDGMRDDMVELIRETRRLRQTLNDLLAEVRAARGEQK